MKNAVILATAVVAAVILVQGVGPSVNTVQERTSSDVVSVSSAPSSSSAALAALGGGKTATASTRAAKTATSTSTSTTTSSAASAVAGTAAHTASVSATSTTVKVAGHSFATTPAQVSSAPAPAPAPTQSSPPPPPPAPTPTCPAAIGGSTAGAPGASDPSGIPGTTTADIASFASQYNALRVANCLRPIPFANIRYSSCLQQRLWWMADDPSTNPLSAWGHTGTAVRSDGVPIVGCDGDLAGGSGYTGATVASAWWASPDHRASLFQPLYTGNVAGVCIAFAMTHGGVNIPGPNEPASFVRAAAYWYSC